MKGSRPNADLTRAIITSILSQLPALFSQVKNPEPALLPTLNAALAALEKTGGKIICSLAALPTWGPGRLFLRDDGKIRDADNDKKLFTTEHPGWRKTAERMVASGVGVDFFLAAPGGGYLDIATIGMNSLFSSHMSIVKFALYRTRFQYYWWGNILFPKLSFSS